MSKFGIYRADSFNPQKTSKLNKRLYFAYSVLLFLIMLTVNVNFSLKKHNLEVIIYCSVLAVLILATLYLVFKMRSQSRNLKKIGLLEFTKTSIRKEIGDLKSSYLYENIYSVEIEKHIRALNVNSSKTGSLTHILKITQIDSSQDSFIISATSIDYKQKISIIETLKTLNRTNGLNIKINNN